MEKIRGKSALRDQKAWNITGSEVVRMGDLMMMMMMGCESLKLGMRFGEGMDVYEGGGGGVYGVFGLGVR